MSSFFFALKLRIFIISVYSFITIHKIPILHTTVIIQIAANIPINPSIFQSFLFRSPEFVPLAGVMLEFIATQYAKYFRTLANVRAIVPFAIFAIFVSFHFTYHFLPRAWRLLCNDGDGNTHQANRPYLL